MVKTLILPVGGMGKRLLPLTKHTPKNLLLVNGKPLIEYALDEAVLCGIKDVAIVVNPKHKAAFEAYIKSNAKRFPSLRFHIRIQETPGGNGHAIAQAYDIAGNKPFAVRFCDDILAAQQSTLKGLIDTFNEKRSSVMLLERIPKKMVSRYGVVGVKKASVASKGIGGKVYEITKIIEKPKASEAPSNLIIIGGYVLKPSILRNLKLVADTLPIVADDALPIAVAFQIELIVGGKIYGWEFPGKRLDCGTLEKLQESEAYLKKHK